MTPGAGTSAAATSTFQAFFNTWLARHRQLLNELLQIQTAGEDADVAAADHLVTRVLAHLQNYYTHKTRLANANVFVVFNPPWFSPLEKTYLWVSGFKPALMIRVATAAVNDITEEQTARIQDLTDTTEFQELALDKALAKIQEGMASPDWVTFTRRRVGPQSSEAQHQPVDGEIREVDDQMVVLKRRLAQVVREADRLRTKTANCIVGILKPYQSVKLFVAFAQLFFRIRERRAQMEAERAQHQNQPGLALDTNGW